ncbi:nucleotidyltransferase domain-containing protein [Pseudonocardia alaniniphila]|uniref:Nucleotidyltransferase domain-containing protein n=1 Tax=Pseudonocardia alaniniphila TaxID=75291 RepID=A0ABS9TQ54_9PSEU|nr:nucleotidyltransferase domain-containing protein [Pseudonocardia alaniniphila]MCH6170673.1 nucleotidyltransferase domain-containing protein [Pseudonocardia alaniniphila]
MHVTDERRAEVHRVLSGVPRWAMHRPDVRAVGLCGSWARNTQRMSSDVDLVVLTESPELYVDDEEWLHDFGSPHVVRTQRWGVLTERRVRLGSGLEVEFGFAHPTWAALTPVDSGTRAVVTDGLQPLYDPALLLAEVVAACAAAPGPGGRPA